MRYTAHSERVCYPKDRPLTTAANHPNRSETVGANPGAAAGDVTAANIDGAENVIVGQGNRQQTGGHGDQLVTINQPHENENDEAATIRLFYELYSRLEGKLEQERREWRAAVDGLRRDIAELARNQATQSQVDDMRGDISQAVVLNKTHRRTFAAGYVLLTMPVPLYFEGFLRVIDLNWPIALLLSLACYGLSAGFWHYMWWPK